MRGYGWRTFRWIYLRIANPVTEKSLEKDVRKQAVEEQCHFFFVACGGLCLRWLLHHPTACSPRSKMFTVPGDLYHSKHIQGQAIEAWRHSFSHKIGGNVLSPVIAISPDRTIVFVFRRVDSFSGDSYSPETNTRAQALAA